jgi:hypothetical protein
MYTGSSLEFAERYTLSMKRKNRFVDWIKGRYIGQRRDWKPNLLCHRFEKVRVGSFLHVGLEYARRNAAQAITGLFRDLAAIGRAATTRVCVRLGRTFTRLSLTWGKRNSLVEFV